MEVLLSRGLLPWFSEGCQANCSVAHEDHPSLLAGNK